MVVGVAAAGVLATGCLSWEEPVAVPVAGFPTSASEAGRLDLDAMVAGDFDGDGRDDLIVHASVGTGNNRKVVLLWSEADGTFTQQDLPSGRWPEAVGDFDGDGSDDVVFGGPGRMTASTPRNLYLGGPAGDGRARGFVEGEKVQLPGALGTLTGDCDGDGNLDLLVCTPFMTYYFRCEPHLNDGSASFTADPDLAVMVAPGTALGGYVDQVRRGGRDRLFDNMTPSTRAWPGLPSAPVAVGDIDGDGDDDAAVIVGGFLVFYRWNGTAAVPFPAYQELPVSGDAFVELLDLDGDDVLDLAFADATGGQYYGGTDDGGFPYAASTDSPAGRVRFADVDGDGFPDAINVTADGGSIVVHRNGAGPDQG